LLVSSPSKEDYFTLRNEYIYNLEKIDSSRNIISDWGDFTLLAQDFRFIESLKLNASKFQKQEIDFKKLVEISLEQFNEYFIFDSLIKEWVKVNE